MSNRSIAAVTLLIVNLAVPGTSGSQEQNVDLMVRTVNTLQGHEHYPKRLLGIARELRQDWFMSIGLIGMQEVKQDMNRCPVEGETGHGAKCFAAIMRQSYGRNTTNASCDELGIVGGSPWEIFEATCWKIGSDARSWHDTHGRSSRYLLEVKVRHYKEGWTVRFYTTHLSHDSDVSREKNRRKQINKINDIIRSRVAQDEFPPIIVGDFNLTETGEPSNFQLMNADFRLVFSSSVDHIWVGRKTSFPQTRGGLPNPLRGHVIVLDKQAVIDGVTVSQLTDHNSPGICFGCFDPAWLVVIK